MRKHVAKFAPAVALSVIAAAMIAAGCSDPITRPGDTAGAMPIDTLFARAPIDTLTAMPIDTLMAVPVDTLY